MPLKSILSFDNMEEGLLESASLKIFIGASLVVHVWCILAARAYRRRSKSHSRLRENFKFERGALILHPSTGYSRTLRSSVGMIVDYVSSLDEEVAYFFILKSSAEQQPVEHIFFFILTLDFRHWVWIVVYFRLIILHALWLCWRSLVGDDLYLFSLFNNVRWAYHTNYSSELYCLIVCESLLGVSRCVWITLRPQDVDSFRLLWKNSIAVVIGFFAFEEW